MGPNPMYHLPKGEGCETPVGHGLPLWAEPGGGDCSRRPSPSPRWESHFVRAREPGPLVREPKPQGKTPMRGNPSPDMTYQPTLSGRGELRGVARVITQVTLRKCTSSFKRVIKMNKC